MNRDFICFSHLRWDFVYQRPQHLLSRFANSSRVFFIEEPIFDAPVDYYSIKRDKSKVCVITPHFESDLSQKQIIIRLRAMIDYVISLAGISNYMAWYYTPMALQFTDHLTPAAIIYDCMDELSAFKFAPAELASLETQLMQKADIVFTGGHSLYQAKKGKHSNIFPFPSSVDKKHFFAARNPQADPPDQAQIPHPRLGFFGVLDERFDHELIRQSAAQRPDLHFVLIGPVVKIDPEDLPQAPNIHYLGGKTYDELPGYLSAWDIGLIPFARNEATRYISPTKTPEYLCGAKPVISTSIHDVVDPYGIQELVRIADTPQAFIQAADDLLNLPAEDHRQWLERVDQFLSTRSWDHTCFAMLELIESSMTDKKFNLKAEKNV